MKKTLLSAFICLLSVSAFSQWTQQNSGTANQLSSVYFPLAHSGYATSTAGDIFYSSDFGANWSTQYVAGNGLNSVFFSDSLHGCAVGAVGIIFTTIDGGATWNFQSSGTSYNLRSVFFLDNFLGAAVGDNGTIIITSDGGTNWTPKTSGTIKNLFSVQFTDMNHGFVGGDSVTLIIDATTVTPQFNGHEVRSVFFSDTLTGYAAGLGGSIQKTIDGGLSWADQTSGTASDLNSIRFNGLTNGYAVGANGTIVSTNNSGITWVSQASGTSSTLNGIYSTDLYNSYAVGDVGTLLKTSNAGCGSMGLNVTGGNNICFGDITSLTVNGSATTYTWQPGNLTGSNQNVSPSVNTTYTVYGSDGGLCLDSTNFTVSILPASYGGALSNGLTVCDTINSGSIFLTGEIGTIIDWEFSTDGGTIWNPIGNTSNSYNYTNLTVTTMFHAVVQSNSCPSDYSTVTTIIINPVLSAFNSPVAPNCGMNNGTLTANVSGGTAPYSYLWSDTQTGTTAASLGAGSYTCTITDNAGCTISTSSFLNNIGAPFVSINAGYVACYGDSTGYEVAVPSGGAPPYTYSWNTVPAQTSDSLKNIPAGYYEVTVTDINGCASIFGTSIGQPSFPLVIGVDMVTPASCPTSNDGAVSVTVSGGTPGYTYSWVPGFTTNASLSNATAGNYTLSVNDNMCPKTFTTTVTVGSNAGPSLSINAPSKLCQGQSGQLSYNITGGTAPYTNNWVDLFTATQISTLDTCIIMQTIAGTDSVSLQVTDAIGCIANKKAFVTINISDSISGLITEPNTNPVTIGKVYLFKQKINNVGVYDTTAIVNINVDGTYALPNVFFGDYFLKVVADTNAGNYPSSIGTYYSNKPNAYQWDSALVLNHYTCGASNVGGYTVAIIEIPPASGPCTISGQLTEGPGYGQRYSGNHNGIFGAPLKGVDIKLGKNPGGSAAARTTSDNNGNYTFSNIPVGSYKIYVDIPNYGMDSVRVINLTTTDTVSTQNNYYVDSLMVRVDTVSTVSIKHVTSVSTDLIVYPNPNNGNINLKSKTDLGLVTIYNALGEIVFKEKINVNLYRIDLRNQAPGIYILQAQGSYLKLLKE